MCSTMKTFDVLFYCFMIAVVENNSANFGKYCLINEYLINFESL